MSSGSMLPPNGLCAKAPRIPDKVTPQASFVPLGFLGVREVRSADSPSPVDSSLNPESGPSASQAVPHSHTTQLPHFLSSADSVCAPSPLLANTFFRPQKVLPPGSPPSPLPHLGSLAGTSMCKQSVINGTCTHAQPKGKQGPGLVHLPAQGPAEPAGASNACARQDRTSRTWELGGSVCLGRT